MEFDIFSIVDPTIIILGIFSVFVILFLLLVLSKAGGGFKLPIALRRFLPFFYPYKVICIKKRAGGGAEVFFDRGRIRKKPDETEEFELQGGMDINPPESSNVFPNKWVFYYMASDGSFQPLVLENPTTGNEAKLMVLSQEQRQLLARQIETGLTSYGKKKSFWERHAPLITIAIVCVFILMMFYIVLPYYNSIATSLQYTADQFVKASQMMSKGVTVEVVNKTPIPW